MQKGTFHDFYQITLIIFFIFPDDPINYDSGVSNGPTSKRNCTDVLCLLLFFFFVIGWAFVGYYGESLQPIKIWKKLTKNFKFSAYREGDFHNIWTPRDSQGFKCGVDSTVKDKPYLVFFDIKECASPSVLALGCNTPQVCVKKCPEKFFLFDKNECNKEGFNSYRENMICKYNVNLNSCDDIESAVKSKECAEYYLKSQPCKSCFSF